jgi:hypothetical protein
MDQAAAFRHKDYFLAKLISFCQSFWRVWDYHLPLWFSHPGVAMSFDYLKHLCEL